MLRISCDSCGHRSARRAVRYHGRAPSPSAARAHADRNPAPRQPRGAGATTRRRQRPPPTKINVAVDAEIDDDDDDMEDMFVDTSMGKEWGGPTRGGRMPEPTRFGDWERKGRATDF